jgi:molybdenum cofactor cytidylyltransferase
MCAERPALHVAALMLAAGYSRRFGSDKRRASLADGRSLLTASLALPCAMLEEVWLVLRPDEAPAALDLPTGVHIVQNPATAQGMGHSLAAGAERLVAESNADAVAIFLADMPLIRRDSWKPCSPTPAPTPSCSPVTRANAATQCCSAAISGRSLPH